MEHTSNIEKLEKPLSSQVTFAVYLEDLENRLIEHYAQMAVNHIEHSRYMVKIFQKDFPDLGKKVAKRLGELNANG